MRALIGLLTGVFLSASPVAVKAGVFDPQSFTLANGMQVVVIENPQMPAAHHMVWYKVGAADEQPGQSGLAHLFEHLMFKGTPNVPPGQFSRIVARHGGKDNAFTSWDYTAYFQTVAPAQLAMVMEMEADRLANLKLDEQIVLTERDVVLEERRTRVDNDPATILSERLMAALFVTHPYGRPVIGWEHEISAMSGKEAMAFHAKWYAPNNAILVVAGGVKAEEVKKLAETYYGPIPAKQLPERVRPPELPQVAARRVELKDARVRQPSWKRKYVAPSLRAGETKHVYALETLAQILGGGTTSRLYRRLAVEQELAAGVSASYQAEAFDLGLFAISASPRPGKSMAELEAAIESEIAKLLKEGITEEELARAKRRIKAEVAYARDSLQAGAMALGGALASGLSIADVEEAPERLNAVTLKEVNEAARAVLKSENSATGVLSPLPKEAKP
jgi:zinc protease